MERAREVTFHQSANRPNLLLGGDRELVLMSALFAAVLIFTLAKLWAAIAGVAFWLVALGVLRRLAKADPMMRQVYVRHIQYKPFYPAKSGVHRTMPGSPKKWR
jgi:type IV secretory pathway TrbD component